MAFRFCHICNCDTLSGASVDRGGATEICSACGMPYPKYAKANETKAIRIVEDEEIVAVQYSLPGLPAPTPPRKHAKVSPALLASEPVDALRTIKTRRRWLRGEIKRLRELETEDKLLAAAEHAVDAARRATVTPIRRTP